MSQAQRRKKQEEANKGFFRKNLSIFAGLALIAGSVLGYSILSPTNEPKTSQRSLSDIIEKVTFEEAKADESKRQQYLDYLISKTGKPDFVEEIVYDPQEEGNSPNRAKVYRGTTGYMMTRPVSGRIMDLGKKRVGVRTRVTRMAFEDMSEEFFHIGLLCHEMHIARCLHKGFTKAPIDVLYYHENGQQVMHKELYTILIEVDAYYSDIDFCKQNNVSEYAIETMIDGFKRYYTALKKILPTLPEQLRPKIKKAIKAYERTDIE